MVSTLHISDADFLLVLSKEEAEITHEALNQFAARTTSMSQRDTAWEVLGELDDILELHDADGEQQ